MYSMCKQTHPVTGVEHCVYAHFFSWRERCLVVAEANLLRVFRLIPDLDRKKDDLKNVKVPKMKLECMASFSLFGTVMAVQAVALAGQQRESLLICFKDAKLSIVEYDPATHDLKTLSLHYFEDDEMKGGWTQHHHIPLLRVDPDSRCAAMLVYGHKMVVLPFRREPSLEEVEALGQLATSSLEPKPVGSAALPGLGGASEGGPGSSSGASAASNAGAKSPILASYTIILKDLDEKMDSVIDIQFLHGYYEPTLLILFEPLKTYSGRLAVRQDTCALVAISLNVSERVHPVIWSVGSLPFDCCQALAVPKPVGGALVLATNSLVYLNQSVPPYGVGLNSLAFTTTNFPLKQPQEEGGAGALCITLDCAQATFLAHDRLVLSLKGGELYVLTLLADSMRTVRSFLFDKAAASVLTTCMCVCETNYLFLGSRLGNSLLLRLLEKEQKGPVGGGGGGEVGEGTEGGERTDKNGDEDQPPSSKRKRLDTLGDWMASDVADIKDPEELEVYGSQDAASVRITSYAFEVCDTLLNIGPCGNVSMGEPAFLSEEFGHVADPDVELVTTSGYGKNGALCVLQRSIRPQVVTTFELPGCEDMWTVVGPQKSQPQPQPKPQIETSDKEDPAGREEKEEDGTGEDANNTELQLQSSHAFMILSREDSSLILQTGMEINEVDNSGFNTQQRTVFAGNLGGNRYVVQVSPLGVRLLLGLEQLQHLPLDLGAPVVQASSADPHLVLLAQDGQLVLMTLREQKGGARLTMHRPQLGQKSRAVAVSAYCDMSGMFTCSVPHEEPEGHGGGRGASGGSGTGVMGGKEEMDDEDELLYGDTDFSAFDQKKAAAATGVRSGEAKPWWHKFTQEFRPSFWLAVGRENSSLELYSLPDFQLSFLVKNFSLGLRVLMDSLGATPLNVGPTSSSTPPPASSSNSAGTRKDGVAEDKSDVGDSGSQGDYVPEILEILLVGLGHRQGRPLLLARTEQELLLYEAFLCYEGLAPDQLKMRFRRMHHGLILRPKKEGSSKRKPAEDSSNKSLVAQLRYFSNIAGYSGVFICGTYPHWLFMTSRGELRVHPMGIDGEICCIAPFHNINCPHGFLYFNAKSELRICVLPTHLSYDAPWPVRKVPLRCTPHFVAYHLDSKTYCVVVSSSEISSRMYKFNGEDKELVDEERPPNFPLPNQPRFSLQIFSPVSWEVIPNTRMELEPWEHVTCLKNVSLASEGTRSGLKGYVAAGTNYNFGEDITSRGRILLMDIIEVVPEPGQPLTKNKFKLLYAKEQKGPVSALSHVMGFLVSAVGQKIYIWQLKDRDLVGIAFIDTQIYIHQMLTVKNLILIADVCKSISLLCFQEEFRTLSLVSRDFRPLEAYAIEYMIDNNQMGFLVSDVEKNILMYMYQPESRESYGGQKLIRRADFHLGQHINSFFRIRCRHGVPAEGESMSASAWAAVERRHITMFATLDGGLGYLLPVSEKTYRRLLMLQNVLVGQISHTAGLNARAFRTFKGGWRHLSNPARGVIDGELVWLFLGLPFPERVEVCKKIGTRAQEIIDDLQTIDRLTAHF